MERHYITCSGCGMKFHVTPSRFSKYKKSKHPHFHSKECRKNYFDSLNPVHKSYEQEMIEFLKTQPMYIKTKYVWEDFTNIHPGFCNGGARGKMHRVGMLLAKLCPAHSESDVKVYRNPYYGGKSWNKAKCQDQETPEGSACQTC